MQTKILYSLIVLLFSITVSAQQPPYARLANSNEIKKASAINVSVVPDKSSAAFRLFVFNPEQKKIGLQISHPENGVVVDTSFTNVQYSRRYNFEQTDDGRYQVTLVSGKEKITKTIRISTVTTRNAIVIE